jgi:hypothetical protein
LGGRGRWISEFEACLVYRVGSKVARATQRNPLKRNKTKQTNNNNNKNTTTKTKRKKKKGKIKRSIAPPPPPRDITGWFVVYLLCLHKALGSFPAPVHAWQCMPTSSVL